MKKFIYILLFSLSLFACTNTKSKTPPESVAGFSSSMQGMRETLSRLLPTLIDPKQYYDSENQKMIGEEIAALNANSKSMTHNQMTQYLDPSLRFISYALNDELKRADESFKMGKKDYARYTMLNVTAFCIECHTRTSSGPAFESPRLEKVLVSLDRMHRGEYLLATRRFDAAFLEFEELIKENLQRTTHFFDLDKAVKNALSISIKFQQSPENTMRIINLLERSANTPYYLKQNARAWNVAVNEWKKEPKNQYKGLAGLLEKSRNLVNKGRQAQIGMSDKGGDVYFYRALSDLHLVLAGNLNKEQLGEALYLTGVAYDSVRDLSSWSLHENYYESCIRQLPHSRWSESCYKKLEESIYFGYTGTTGLNVPVDVHLKLQELQKLALSQFIK